MKKIIYATFVLVAILAGTHLFLWPLNQDIYKSHVKQRNEFQRKPIENFSDFRMKYEAQQKDNLNRYRRIEKRSEYVQIPIERAFDYYLRTHPKL